MSTPNDNKSLTTDQVFDDPAKIASYVFAFRQINKTEAVIVIESSRDGLVFTDLLHTLSIKLLPVKGKSICIDSVQQSLALGIDGCAALVDADFDRTEWGSQYNVPVFLTDFHDLECYAIFSDSWDRVLRENIDPAKLSVLNRTSFDEFRELCVELCLPLGIALLSNNRNDLGIDFKKYDFNKKCDVHDALSNDISNVVRRLSELHSARDNPKLDEQGYAALRQTANEILSAMTDRDKRQLVSSKMICDCVIGLGRSKRIFRKEVGAQLNSLSLRKWFRSNIRPEDLHNTQLWTDLTEWLS